MRVLDRYAIAAWRAAAAAHHRRESDKREREALSHCVLLSSESVCFVVEKKKITTI